MKDISIPVFHDPLFRNPPGPYRVVRWRKQEGEQVRYGDLLCLVVTETQLPVEIFAPAEGRLQHVYVSEGANVNLGDVLATVYERWDLPMGLVAVSPLVFGFCVSLVLVISHPILWYLALALLCPAIGCPFVVVVETLQPPFLQRWFPSLIGGTVLLTGAGLLTTLLEGQNPLLFLVSGGLTLGLLLDEYFKARRRKPKARGIAASE